MEDMLKSVCKKLHFSINIIENAKQIKSEDNLNFLLKLFTLELENRELKRKNAYIKAAKFDVLKTFEDYSFVDIKIPKSITHTDILDTTFINKKENLILYGNVGSGKTHLAIATGIAACNNGKRVKFYRTAALVNSLVDAKKQGNIIKFMRNLEKCDLLILDDWGYVPVDIVGSKLLFQVVAECYERKSIIITTNLEFTMWNEIFCDEKITAAIIDRIIHHSHLLDFTNRNSRRLQNSLIKLK
jgi:DNA replication protein DnaC